MDPIILVGRWVKVFSSGASSVTNESHPGRIIRRSFPPDDLSRPFRADSFPTLYARDDLDDLYDMYDRYDVAHVAGWELYNLHALAHVSGVGTVPCRKSATSHNGIRGAAR